MSIFQLKNPRKKRLLGQNPYPLSKLIKIIMVYVLRGEKIGLGFVLAGFLHSNVSRKNPPFLTKNQKSWSRLKIPSRAVNAQDIPECTCWRGCDGCNEWKLRKVSPISVEINDIFLNYHSERRVTFTTFNKSSLEAVDQRLPFTGGRDDGMK